MPTLALFTDEEQQEKTNSFICIVMILVYLEMNRFKVT